MPLSEDAEEQLSVGSSERYIGKLIEDQELDSAIASHRTIHSFRFRQCEAAVAPVGFVV